MSQGLGYSYYVNIDTHPLGYVQEVAGLKFEIDVVEQKEVNGAGKLVITRLAGRHKGGDLTFTRVLKNGDKSWETWLKESFGGLPTAFTSGSVEIRDSTGEPVLEVKFNRGYATKLEGSASKAGGTDVRTEKITISHNGLSIPAAQLMF